MKDESSIIPNADLIKDGLDNSSAILWMNHPNGQCVYLNRCWERVTGVPIDKGLELGWQQVMHPDDLKENSKLVADAQNKRQAFRFEFRILTAAKEYRWFIAEGHPNFDKAGNYLGMVGWAFDYHQSRLTTAALSLKSRIIENSLNGFDVVDSEGIFLYVNQAYIDMWGFASADEVVGTSPREHCADPNTALTIINRLKADGECDIEFLAKRKDGSKFHVRMIAFLAFDNDGNEIYPSTSIDITEQKLLEDHLKSNEDRLLTLIDSMPQMTFVADSKGNIVYYNQQHYRYFNSPSQAPSNDWHQEDLHHPDDLEKTVKTWSEAVATGQTYEIEYRLRRHDGVFRWHLGRAKPIKDENGKITQWLGTNTDIHEQKLVEVELKTAKDAAERANKTKSNFLANMSHEIRTPLGAMLGFANLLRNGNLTPQERELSLDILLKNGEQLSLLINDILDFSKIEAERMKIDSSKFALRELVSEVVELFGINARERGVKLIDQTKLTPDIIVESDRVKMRQILVNLLGNAIKFTEKGAITISFGRQTNKLFHFFIKDTGLGIAQSEKDTIFESFIQSDNRLSKSYSGTGLGLSLAKSFAQLLGGDVWVEDSQLGIGTTMGFEFAQDLSSEYQSSSPTSKQNMGILKKLKNISSKVLIVDDSIDNRRLFALLLEKEKYQVSLAENGVEAIAKVQNEEFDLVIMDIQMPILDGYEATKKIRELGHTIPIVALTAHALSEMKKDCLDLGFSHFLTKPVKSEELFRTIESLLVK